MVGLNGFLFLCLTDGFADIDVGLLASGCEMSGECYEILGRPNEFLFPFLTDGRSMGCVTSAEGHESLGRPNEFLFPFLTGGRSIQKNLASGCEM